MFLSIFGMNYSHYCELRFKLLIYGDSKIEISPISRKVR